MSADKLIETLRSSFPKDRLLTGSASRVSFESDGLTAFAVSLEPEGGVQSPTGDIYLVGVVPGE